MADDFTEFFKNQNIKIIFATAPTGLGHIRVTEALKEALGDVPTETIGIMNPTSQFLHRVMSRSLVLRYLMEVFQSNPVLEILASWVYRKRLRTGNRAVRKYLEGLVGQRRILKQVQDDVLPQPIKTVIIVATHFGLAHQVVSIRKRLERETNVRLLLAVIVTDDSPQKMWAVDGSDVIFVPSTFCAKGIKKHLGARIGSTKVVVNPYPITPSLNVFLSHMDYEKRLSQTDPKPGEKLKIMIPVSGAAVQLSYFQNVIHSLKKKKDVEFSIVSRRSEYTKDFLSWCRRQQNVIVESSMSDHEVVQLYDHNLSSHVFSVEITKPSEQTFKALLTPKMRGGVILLFSRPVGRQEYDNVHFLERHGLVPNAKDMFTLNALWLLNQQQLVDQEFLKRAQKWRGILLPRNGNAAAHAIMKLHETGIIEAMARFDNFHENGELKSDGAEEFWKKLQNWL